MHKQGTHIITQWPVEEKMEQERRKTLSGFLIHMFAFILNS